MNMPSRYDAYRKGSCLGFFLSLTLGCGLWGAAPAARSQAATSGGWVSPVPGTVSGLNAREFKKYWTVESESPDYRVSFSGDTVEILSPKGLTLWRNECMKGDVVVEYDACLVDEGLPCDRPSDLNCFWMASDPLSPADILARKEWRSGIFARCYTLQLYYLGYGGNSNRTTRFRRYDGDAAGVMAAEHRPAILREYTDETHLNVANRWRHIRLTAQDSHITYTIDGERLVDFRDPDPLRFGWFGFRTTWSHVRLTNFRYTAVADADVPITLHWITKPAEVCPEGASAALEADSLCPVSFGVPFAKGVVMPQSSFVLQPAPATGRVAPAVPLDFRPLAFWPDGSVKWGGFEGAAPYAETFALRRSSRVPPKRPVGITCTTTPGQYVIRNGAMTLYLPRVESGRSDASCGQWLDSLLLDGRKVAGSATWICARQNVQRTCHIDSSRVERCGAQSLVVKICGRQWGAEAFPFVLRLYLSAGSRQVRMVHTFLNDREASAASLQALGVRFTVPMREALYNRHVAFSGAEGGVWSEPVQPLVGRRTLYLTEADADRDLSAAGSAATPSLYARQMAGEPIPQRAAFSPKYRSYLDQWASWDGFRLSQLNDMSYTVRKRAKNESETPWIGTFSGTRSSGCAFVGDVSGGLAVALHDFWQSYPSTLEVSGATAPVGISDSTQLTLWLWSPEAEPMDLRHYDTEAHGLDAAYEDVQPGMSTPYGVGRTSTLTFEPLSAYPGKAAFAALADRLTTTPQLICSPEYLHRHHAFGIWSLPDRSDSLRAGVEDRLSAYADYYRRAIDDYHWYGFWNYGDVMHAYDLQRHEWLYDVGGFAWDNTELASNMWLWYSFLRTGRADLWQMAVAMTRHTSEVDVYHLGSHAGLGSRHNVTHWGCGAKEARISQAAWNRFYYYLTGDDRTGDLMTAERDADTLLYHLDPMRLAQPRELYPCTAPARLRIGPDWLAYAGNWMTEWERTGNLVYRDKILAGMQSISDLPHGLFTGPKALGYDPATGIISYEGDTALQNTNHLLPIMGGFEMMNELLELLPARHRWEQTWLDFCADYRAKADSISHNHFRIPRLAAYAAYRRQDTTLRAAAWRELLGRSVPLAVPPLDVKTLAPPFVPAARQEVPGLSTNGVATWCLDAIYLLEVCPIESKTDAKAL